MSIQQHKTSDVRSQYDANAAPGFIIKGKRALSGLAALFLIAILFVFPVYYRNFYYDILPGTTTKLDRL